MAQVLKQWAVIIADGEIDMKTEWSSDAVQHVKDLRKMGCNVRIKIFNSAKGAEAFEDRWRS